MTAKDRYQAGRTDLVYWLRSHGEALKRSGSEWEWKYHDERVTLRGTFGLTSTPRWAAMP